MTQNLEHDGMGPSLDAILMAGRYRSDGILCNTGLSLCKEHGIATAFDPLQGGWVPAHVTDDLRPARRDIPMRPRPIPIAARAASNIHLRSWAASDVARYVDLLDDPALWNNMPEDYPNPLTPDLAAALIEIANNSNHHQVYALVLHDRPVGQVRIEFNDGDTDTRTAEISYWIGRAYWGQGIASDAVTAFAHKCLADNPNLTSLTARVKIGNTASFRVLEKAGFVMDGPDAKQGWHRFKKQR
jgi:RimJ/RimL family protein N-acetyltransferase